MLEGMDTDGSTPPPSSSGPRTAPPSKRNAATRLGLSSASNVPGVDPDRLVASFDWARRGALLTPPAIALGYRVFWTRPPAMGFLDLAAAPGEYAVLGRHDHCSGVLLDDPGISLRHLLLTSYPLDGGGVALRLLDLMTAMPLFLDDGIPRRSLVTTGAARIRLGSYVIGALPIVGGAIDASAALAEASAPVEVHELSIPPRITLSSRSSTGIASLPAISHSQVFSYRESARRPPSAGTAQLTLRRDRHAVVVEVTDDDLARGILLGRADRCLDGGLRRMLTASISRTHLLLLRDRGRTFAFDVASTNGTYQHGKRVRRSQLDDQGASLWLGPRDGVWLDYRRGPTLH